MVLCSIFLQKGIQAFKVFRTLKQLFDLFYRPLAGLESLTASPCKVCDRICTRHTSHRYLLRYALRQSRSFIRQHIRDQPGSAVRHQFILALGSKLVVHWELQLLGRQNTVSFATQAFAQSTALVWKEFEDVSSCTLSWSAPKPYAVQAHDTQDRRVRKLHVLDPLVASRCC